MSGDYSLGIVTGRRGACSETFIQRHVMELKPGETVTISWFVDTADNCWESPGPELIQGSKSLFKIRRATHRGLCKAGSVVGIRLNDFGPWPTRVKRFLKHYQVRAVLGEFLDVSYTYIDTFKSLRVPFYVHAHGYDVSKLIRKPTWQKRYLDLNESSGVITINQVSRERLIDIGIDADRVHVIPYGVDVPSTYPRRSSELDRNNGKVRCLAVGRMTAKKAPIVLLKAFRKAVSLYPGMSLDFAGDGELMPLVAQFIEDNALSKQVTLHGWMDSEEIQKLMNDCDVFLQHSIVDPKTGDEEGLPVAILEAMAHGLPVVATRHAGIPEQVVENATGYLVDEQDFNTMAEHIVALADDPVMRHEFGHAGWQRARDCFAWQLERQRLLQLMGLDN